MLIRALTSTSDIFGLGHVVRGRPSPSQETILYSSCRCRSAIHTITTTTLDVEIVLYISSFPCQIYLHIYQTRMLKTENLPLVPFVSES